MDEGTIRQEVEFLVEEVCTKDSPVDRQLLIESIVSMLRAVADRRWEIVAAPSMGSFFLNASGDLAWVDRSRSTVFQTNREAIIFLERAKREFPEWAEYIYAVKTDPPYQRLDWEAGSDVGD